MNKMDNNHSYSLSCNCEKCYQISFDNYWQNFLEVTKKVVLKMENKDISIWGEELIENNLLKCDYFDKEKCNKLAKWKHRQGRFYCDFDHEKINKINEFKENINKYFFLPIKNEFILRNFTKKDIKIFLDKLNSGKFDV